MSQSLKLRKRHAKWRVDLAIHEALEQAQSANATDAFRRLLAAVRAQSTLLRAMPVGGHAGWRDAPTIVKGLLALTEFRKHWLREPCQWSAPCGPLLIQFGSLAAHLLATHCVPKFMTLVWFEEGDQRSQGHRKLYRHLGLGNSIRGADLPLKLTRSMAEFFRDAPAHFTVEQALRWSQVRGLGGSRELALRVATTRLGSSFEDASFWNNALGLLAREDALETELVPEIIEQLYRRRGVDRLACLRSLSKKGFRTFQEEVRRQTKEHHSRRGSNLTWAATNVRGFDWSDESSDPWSHRTWSVRELLDSQALADEGGAQRHCVAGYAERCARRATSIWSLRCNTSLTSRRILTLEVDLQRRRIVTALGHCNRRPKKNELEILVRWAAEAELEIAEHVKRWAR